MILPPRQRGQLPEEVEKHQMDSSLDLHDLDNERPMCHAAASEWTDQFWGKESKNNSEWNIDVVLIIYWRE